jgi:hypothetical protein
MNEEFHLVPMPADAEMGDLLEALGPIAERPSQSQYCVFRSGRERFCLPVLDVEEVVEWPLITRLPLSPAYVLGIFNLRGAIVPLIDIALTEGRRTGLLPSMWWSLPCALMVITMKYAWESQPMKSLGRIR